MNDDRATSSALPAMPAIASTMRSCACGRKKGRTGPNAARCSALATLPREQRDVIELAYWGDYTQAEIASRLGIPLGTIKSRAALGLRKLARTLNPRDFQ